MGVIRITRPFSNFSPINNTFGIREVRHFKCRVLVDKRSIIARMTYNTRQFKFRKISDNILESVQGTIRYDTIRYSRLTCAQKADEMASLI